MRTVDVDKVRAVIEPAIVGQTYELVDLEWKLEAGAWVLRVFIDGPGGVGLEDCARVSHLLSSTLDVSDLITVAYSLEVSSPGLNRPLRKEADFRRFIGEKAKIRTRHPVGESRRNFSGRLMAVVDGRVSIDVGDRTYEVPVGDVEQANLVYDFSKE